VGLSVCRPFGLADRPLPLAAARLLAAARAFCASKFTRMIACDRAFNANDIRIIRVTRSITKTQ
jgi:hypothetical protein